MQSQRSKGFVVGFVAFAVVVAGVSGCGRSSEVSSDVSSGEAATLSGSILVDGSSTVYPISEAVAEEFMKLHPGVRVSVGTSGTGGGFKKFCAGEIDISDASRPIKPSEAELAAQQGIQYIELPVAYDGLSVVVHPKNDFVDYLSVEELRQIWQPNSSVRRWSDVRPNWPAREIKLYGPGADSGTFDYFTEVICGKSGASRQDFTASEDDNTLVTGVAGDLGSLGYFGYAYYAENQEQLKLVPIKSGDGKPVAPSEKTIEDGTYQPLARPVFIYVSAKSAERREVQAFVRFYLTQGPSLVREVKYHPLSERIYTLALQRFEQRKTGSVFAGKAPASASRLEELLEASLPQ